MHKYDPAAFAFTSVKGEVTEAMRFDWKRDKIDDAKKRAIYDAKSYDDFTSRVKGCTLKPIHKNDFNAPPKYAFNRQGASGTSSESALPYSRSAPCGAKTAAVVRAGAAAAAAAAVGSAAFKLKTGRELERELRRRDTAVEKAELLASLDGDVCARLFARELDAEVLRQMLLILEEAGAPGAGRQLLKDLAFRCPNQTSMASTFLTPQERGVAARLLARDPAGDEDEDVRICAAMSVPPGAVAVAAALAAASRPGNQEEQQPDAAADPRLETPPAAAAEAQLPALATDSSGASDTAAAEAAAVAPPASVGFSCEDMD